MTPAEFDRIEAERDAADAARRAATVVHIRKRMPRSTSTSNYLDRRDLSAHAVTFCGAPITDVDVAWAQRATKWTTANACPECVAVSDV